MFSSSVRWLRWHRVHRGARRTPPCRQLSLVSNCFESSVHLAEEALVNLKLSPQREPLQRAVLCPHVMWASESNALEERARNRYLVRWCWSPLGKSAWDWRVIDDLPVVPGTVSILGIQFRAWNDNDVLLEGTTTIKISRAVFVVWNEKVRAVPGPALVLHSCVAKATANIRVGLPQCLYTSEQRKFWEPPPVLPSEPPLPLPLVSPLRVGHLSSPAQWPVRRQLRQVDLFCACCTFRSRSSICTSDERRNGRI